MLDDFLYIPPFEMHQVCVGRLEIRLPVVLGILTVFRHFFQMFPKDLDIVVPLLIMIQLVRLYMMNT